MLSVFFIFTKIKKRLMKRILSTLVIIALPALTSAQNISNSLEGYYKSNKKDALYTSFYFDGKGHVLISDSYNAEYVVVDKTVYVFPDKSVFIFTLDNDKLTGKSNWVEKTTYKKTKTPILSEDISIPTYKVDPNFLFEFYRLNYKDGTDETSFDYFENPEEYNKSIKNLCDKGLTTACAAQFGILYIEALGGLDQLLENTTTTLKPNLELENLANHIIKLGDIRGYGLLASYYFAIGNEDRGNEILEQGIELGDQNSSNLMLQLELNKMQNEIETSTEETN